MVVTELMGEMKINTRASMEADLLRSKRTNRIVQKNETKNDSSDHITHDTSIIATTGHDFAQITRTRTQETSGSAEIKTLKEQKARQFREPTKPLRRSHHSVHEAKVPFGVIVQINCNLRNEPGTRSGVRYLCLTYVLHARDFRC